MEVSNGISNLKVLGKRGKVLKNMLSRSVGTFIVMCSTNKTISIIVGVGCTRNYADNWIAHQDDFNSLLANLNSVGSSGTAETGYGSDPEPVRVQKLAEKSQTAKGRVP